ncbi:hypothetical protein LSTR_LSTR008467 [Laodelphax striatellus]|uniref:Large ribosomal subunit protein mL42 n=1 Tax=Laodelphax striatellus TaxID=195883 RepID=A0A482XZ32_LAOST|nr:hypothetical protein LSTR_LSTR008467 [Laodelphax striatellus]
MFRAADTLCKRTFVDSVKLFSNARFSSKVREDRIAITDDGSTIVCWHPKKSFPYEFTKSLPVEVIPENTVLKVQNKSDIYEVFKQHDEVQMREELMRMTHTTKHRWFPNNQRYRKTFKRIKGDREYL